MYKYSLNTTLFLLLLAFVSCKTQKASIKSERTEKTSDLSTMASSVPREILGILNGRQTFRIPGSEVTIELSRYQPKLGGFIGSAPHNTAAISFQPHDPNPMDTDDTKDSVLAWLGDNSMMLYALTLDSYKITSESMSKNIFKNILDSRVRGSVPGEFQDGRILSLKSLQKESVDPKSLELKSPKIYYFHRECGPSTDAKPMIGVVKYAADKNDLKKLGLAQLEDIDSMILHQHTNFIAGKEHRTCLSGPEQGKPQHDYRKASSLAFHLMNTTELYRMKPHRIGLVRKTFEKLQTLKKGEAYGPEGSLGQSIVLYSLKRASDVVAGDIGNKIRTAYKALYAELAAEVAIDGDTQVMGWFLLATTDTVDKTTLQIIQNLKNNRVCVDGGGFSFLGKAGKQGMGPVEDMAMGLAAIGNLRSLNLYSDDETVCQ